MMIRKLLAMAPAAALMLVPVGAASQSPQTRDLAKASYETKVACAMFVGMVAGDFDGPTEESLLLFKSAQNWLSLAYAEKPEDAKQVTRDIDTAKEVFVERYNTLMTAGDAQGAENLFAEYVDKCAETDA